MKKLLLLLSLFYFTNNGFSQPNFPFPVQNATWGVETYVYSIDITVPDDCITSHYGYSGDTIIGDKNYGKLYGNNLPQDVPFEDVEFNIETATYVAAIREDSTQKVWVLMANDTAEILYYDFSLEVGDTFCFEYFGGGCYEVEFVDSMLVAGDYRKLIHFSTTNGEEWVEGIGSLTGWFKWQYTGNIGYRLGCFSQDENFILGNSQCHCDTYTSTEMVSSENNIEIFPNPAKEQLNIKIESSEVGKFKIELFSILGKKLWEINSANSMTQINLHGLENGIYFLSISNSKNQPVVQKIIKED